MQLKLNCCSETEGEAEEGGGEEEERELEEERGREGGDNLENVKDENPNSKESRALSCSLSFWWFSSGHEQNTSLKRCARASVCVHACACVYSIFSSLLVCWENIYLCKSYMNKDLIIL